MIQKEEDSGLLLSTHLEKIFHEKAHSHDGDAPLVPYATFGGWLTSYCDATEVQEIVYVAGLSVRNDTQAETGIPRSEFMLIMLTMLLRPSAPQNSALTVATRQLAYLVFQDEWGFLTWEGWEQLCEGPAETKAAVPAIAAASWLPCGQECTTTLQPRRCEIRDFWNRRGGRITYDDYYDVCERRLVSEPLDLFHWPMLYRTFRRKHIELFQGNRPLSWLPAVVQRFTGTRAHTAAFSSRARSTFMGWSTAIESTEAGSTVTTKADDQKGIDPRQVILDNEVNLKEAKSEDKHEEAESENRLGSRRESQIHREGSPRSTKAKSPLTLKCSREPTGGEGGDLQKCEADDLSSGSDVYSRPSSTQTVTEKTESSHALSVKERARQFDESAIEAERQEMERRRVAESWKGEGRRKSLPGDDQPSMGVEQSRGAEQSRGTEPPSKGQKREAERASPEAITTIPSSADAVGHLLPFLETAIKSDRDYDRTPAEPRRFSGADSAKWFKQYILRFVRGQDVFTGLTSTQILNDLNGMCQVAYGHSKTEDSVEALGLRTGEKVCVVGRLNGDLARLNGALLEVFPQLTQETPFDSMFNNLRIIFSGNYLATEGGGDLRSLQLLLVVLAFKAGFSSKVKMLQGRTEFQNNLALKADCVQLWNPIVGKEAWNRVSDVLQSLPLGCQLGAGLIYGGAVTESIGAMWTRLNRYRPGPHRDGGGDDMLLPYQAGCRRYPPNALEIHDAVRQSFAPAAVAGLVRLRDTSEFTWAVSDGLWVVLNEIEDSQKFNVICYCKGLGCITVDRQPFFPVNAVIDRPRDVDDPASVLPSPRDVDDPASALPSARALAEELLASCNAR